MTSSLILPGSNTSCLLYSSEICSALIPAIPLLELTFKIFNKSSTFFFESRLMLVCQDVEPVPVDTHNPELFVFVITCVVSVLGLICKCDTRADNVSPIKTYNQSSNINIKNFYFIIFSSS